MKKLARWRRDGNDTATWLDEDARIGIWVMHEELRRRPRCRRTLAPFVAHVETDNGYESVPIGIGESTTAQGAVNLAIVEAQKWLTKTVWRLAFISPIPKLRVRRRRRRAEVRR